MTTTTNQHDFSALNQSTHVHEQTRATTVQRSIPGLLLRLEGLAIAVTAVTLYAINDYRWWVLALLVLAPDLSALGYLINRRVGAICYNIVHTYVLPLALVMAGYLFGEPLAIQLALIWFVHIGVDRLAGYGLKYSDSFKRTHIQAVSQATNQ